MSRRDMLRILALNVDAAMATRDEAREAYELAPPHDVEAVTDSYTAWRRASADYTTALERYFRASRAVDEGDVAGQCEAFLSQGVGQ